MGKITGFMDHRRSLPVLRPAAERIGNWEEFHDHFPENVLRDQGARCMNCGIPFCHDAQITTGVTTGCPVNNLIPEWNDLVYRGLWHEAYKRLTLTNNFPEFTGKVCPAPCEASCVLGINDDPVMIKEIELAIVDRAFGEGWVIPKKPSFRTGKRVAIIGSGPAGLACADQLNKFGHNVKVFERSDRIGGLLMYGIPNMKLEKNLIERRVNLMRDEGVEFCTNVDAGVDISAEELIQEFEAIVLTVGAAKPRDLAIDGRQLKNIHFAMDFLSSNTKSLLDSGFADGQFIDVRGKNILVIGGGDTGTDCIASSLRHGCKSLVQFEIMDRPADRVPTLDAWLSRVRTFQTDYGQEEAIATFGPDPRQFNVWTKRFIGDEQDSLVGVEIVEVDWSDNGPQEVDGTQKFWHADIIFLAMGFVGAEKSRLIEDLGVNLTHRRTVEVDENKRTNVPNVFAAGDCERGQSLVVWAIADGRRAAKSVDESLGQAALKS
ncbi:MAG: glutamate synthase subunit beta [Acidobacteriota bacterium]